MRRGSGLAGALLVIASGVGPVPGAIHEVSIDIPDRREAFFELPFSVEHGGRLTVTASWPSPRVLWFRVEGPGTPPLRAQRSGPSPQRLQIEVPEDRPGSGTEWKLSIRALPDRGAVRANVVLELPEPGETSGEPVLSEQPKAPSTAPLEPWLQAVPARADSPAEMRALYEAVERFRAGIVNDAFELRPDPCAWQSSFLREMAGIRDGIASGRPAPGEDRRCFGRLGSLVRRVDELRRSNDPALVGPEPEEQVLKLAWRSNRNETIRPLERELDELQEAVRKGDCPQAEGNWLPRLVACLTACERYFEGRPRLGEDAPNRDLATEQWIHILGAGAVLEAVSPEP